MAKSSYCEFDIIQALRRAGELYPRDLVAELAGGLNPRYKEHVVRESVWRLIDEGKVELTNDRKLIYKKNVMADRDPEEGPIPCLNKGEHQPHTYFSDEDWPINRALFQCPGVGAWKSDWLVRLSDLDSMYVCRQRSNATSLQYGPLSREDATSLLEQLQKAQEYERNYEPLLAGILSVLTYLKLDSDEQTATFETYRSGLADDLRLKADAEDEKAEKIWKFRKLLEQVTGHPRRYFHGGGIRVEPTPDLRIP